MLNHPHTQTHISTPACADTHSQSWTWPQSDTQTLDQRLAGPMRDQAAFWGPQVLGSPHPLLQEQRQTGEWGKSLCRRTVCEAMPRSGPQPHWPRPGGVGWESLGKPYQGSFVYPSPADALKRSPCPGCRGMARERQGKGYS